MAGRGSTAAAQQALTEQDVTAVRDEVSAGRTVTVWFTSAAVGVPAGGSAKIVAVGDLAEGDFIQVRPAGSRDAVFCSPSELTRTRPARKPAAKAVDDTPAPAATPARPARARRPTGGTAAASSTAPSPEPPTERPTASADLPAPEKPAPEKPATPEPATLAAPAPAKPAKATPARTRQRERSGAMTVSLTSTDGGDWTVEVLVGTKRVVSSTPVQAADVAAASRSLPTAVAEVVTSALVEARRRQQERVALLREELDAAQRTLEQLGAD